MPLLNKLFGKSKSSVKHKEEKKFSEKIIEVPKKAEPIKKITEFKSDGILISPLTTEKAVSSQSSNKYVFKVMAKANKIDIMRAVSKTYNVKVVSANIINIPRKARRVGRTLGFKSGYKKAIVTLAKGQSIEVK
jgi:large subunit ribosomal protein L23